MKFTQNIIFPLSVKVFKPKRRLKAEDKYKTKIELATEIITELIDQGFNIKLVLADSLYVANYSEINAISISLCCSDFDVIMQSGYQLVRALER